MTVRPCNPIVMLALYNLPARMFEVTQSESIWDKPIAERERIATVRKCGEYLLKGTVRIRNKNGSGILKPLNSVIFISAKNFQKDAVPDW